MTSFLCDYAKLGTAGCKKCKVKLEKGALRLAKVTPNPFTDGEGEMKQYFHPKCLFETFTKARSTTKVVDSPNDLQNYDSLKAEDQNLINNLIDDLSKVRSTPKKTATKRKKPKSEKKKSLPSRLSTSAVSSTSTKSSPTTLSPEASSQIKTSDKNLSKADDNMEKLKERDNSFIEFRKLCAQIAEQSSHTMKTASVSEFLRNGTSGTNYPCDAYLLLKVLLPGVVKSVYNMDDKPAVKHFSQGCYSKSFYSLFLEEMMEHLEDGDVSDTISAFFGKSSNLKPQLKSMLSMQEVDAFLSELTKYTKEEDQLKCLTKITKRLCTSNDLKTFIRLVKHDLRINCGSKLILDGLSPKAYEAFKASRDLKKVVDMILNVKCNEGKVKVQLSLMTPVQPMLAEACKSVDVAFKKCPNGMYAEIKYDGERVQLHKQGDHYQYFSRSLKPVLDHKVKHLKDFIPLAFPGVSDLVLDSEVLLIDNKTGKPLPFGTLGVHKKSAFKDANVCLFIFDCLHYNGQSLLNRPLIERRDILHKNMTQVNNHVMFSEMTHIMEEDDLVDLMMRVFREGLEGLVLKDINGIYEPGMRHWLKVKKDYLGQGCMADSADLVVLGAYFGTGSKGGMKSVFLMGSHDEDTKKWCTVTKCGSGLDDATLNKLQTSIKMVKISKDAAKIPKWLNVSKKLLPDFVVLDPKESPVWEIIGTEFTLSDVHTAGGISIRFPRIQNIRDDKTYKEATDVKRLKLLYKKSKEHSKIEDMFSGRATKKRGKQKDRDGDEGEGRAKEEKEEGDEEEEDDDRVTDEPGSKDAKKDYNDDGDKDDSTSKHETNYDNKSGADGVAGSSKENSCKNDTNKLNRTTSSSCSSNQTSYRPACRYGSNCYQKSFLHRIHFKHPKSNDDEDDDDARNNDDGGGGDDKFKLLPNIFVGLKFSIPSLYTPSTAPSTTSSITSSLKDEEKKMLKRYITAYGGDVIDDDVIRDECDYVILHDSDVKNISKDVSKDVNSKYITPYKVWQIIKNGFN
ncbi:hypothetical protein HELRODRAFT_113751 [Helobdella robusta]|uniref:DNA ligase n=1 Tax=Helobdella robusta TaxID=6412 RepID=T1EFV9_HELRO|nr:hypothetical protein HELRODRAFT_113751 [Helobdella robusta]ESN98431.1 hypothetical protein HELRODRAFT_113751 [Helobdella robusta]